jgi:antitoxin PrlF
MTLTSRPESKLTDRYQTTVPDPVRKALGLSKRDRICYNIQPDGKVWISRVEQSEDDPLIEKFLDFLARDMEEDPGRLQVINVELLDRIQRLVGDVDLDLDEMLMDEDD